MVSPTSCYFDCGTFSIPYCHGGGTPFKPPLLQGSETLYPYRDPKVTQEEQLLCEIHELNTELQQSKDRTAKLEKRVRNKQDELYWQRMSSESDYLYRLLDIDGYLYDNCRNICTIVKAWLPVEMAVAATDDYLAGYNDYRNLCLEKLMPDQT